MTAWAAGKRALAICDICGRTCKYKELKRNINAQRWTGLLVCEECNDRDHPQLMLGRFRVDDPIALENARPDFPNTEGLAGWNPVHNIQYGFTLNQAYAHTQFDATNAGVPTAGIVSVPMIQETLRFSLGTVSVYT